MKKWNVAFKNEKIQFEVEVVALFSLFCYTPLWYKTKKKFPKKCSFHIIRAIMIEEDERNKKEKHIIIECSPGNIRVKS